MIKDNLQIQTSLYPNNVFITIENNDITYREFGNKIFSIQSYISSFNLNIHRININFTDPFYSLASIIACNRLNIAPVICPINEYIIKSVNYKSIVKYEFELNDNCIIQDKGKNKEIGYVYDDDGVQCILFTSGTQSEPRAVELTFGNILNSSYSWNKIANFSNDDKYLNILPIHHISGLSIFFRSIYFNFRSFLYKYNRNEFLSLIHNNNISCISVVPKILLDIKKERNHNILQRCKIIIVGGDSITREIFDYLLENNINGYVSYGMTETASGIAGYFIKKNKEYKAQYLGTPHKNVNISIKDDKIHIKSPSIMKGYVNQSPCKKTFTSDDSGYIDNNNIYIKSRKKNIIISGGENINIKIIEDIISNFNSGINFIVIGINDTTWGEVPIVLIENKINKTIISQIKKYCKESLPKYMLPKYFIPIERIPIKNGKPDYHLINNIIQENIQ